MQHQSKQASVIPCLITILLILPTRTNTQDQVKEHTQATYSTQPEWSSKTSESSTQPVDNNNNNSTSSSTKGNKGNGNKYTYDYIVVGAGPSGLQMGYFLEQAGRDYVVLERANHSGDFFATYPRHDRLISINKRNTGQTNKEFNLRHDWNSLLSHDESLLLKHYSKVMFPDRKDLFRYLNDYEKKLGINVQHNTEVHNISHSKSQDDFYKVTLNDHDGNSYSCRTLIIATGVSKPVTAKFQGSEHVVGYEDMSLDPEDYEGKTVLIFGRGNTAFEVAESIYGNTNLVHMVGRSRVRLSWETHYVGDLRAVNNALLDTYQLKSLDGVLEARVEEVQIIKTEDGRYALEFAESNETEDIFDNFAMREPYDVIISCLGWMFDSSIFNNGTKVTHGKSRKKKFPLVYYDYRSELENIYYTGTISHFVDFRKSAGGFIHGFRYTARALHHILEYQNHGVPWPKSTKPIDQLLNTIVKRINEASGTYQMFGILCDVILIKGNGASFEYYEEFPLNLVQRFHQYTGSAADVSNLIVVVFEYGKNFSGPGKDTFRSDRATGEPSEAHTSNFLHPVLYYYRNGPTIDQMSKKDKAEILPKPDRLHHIVEDFLTEFTAPTSHILPLRRFLEAVLGEDLRYFFAEDCAFLSLTQSSLPHTCSQYLLGRQTGGLTARGNIQEGSLDNLIL